jgi:predicted O-methyltransferase YrrM
MSLTHTPITDELADYIRRVTLREPEVLRRLRQEAEGRSDLSVLQIGPEQGQFLYLLACILGARKTLEVGVLMGYSSTWVALALPPGGKVVACDCNPEYAVRAGRTWREAGVEDKIELRLAPALETLDALVAEGQAGTFDLVFIDADKGNYTNYYERSLELLRTGGLIVVDNVLWHGRPLDPNDQTVDTKAIRAFNRKLHADDRVALSMVTMGDGLTLASKL